MYTSYLNLFQTHTDYEMYLLGNNTMPNVSYCTGQNHVHYLRYNTNPNKPSILAKNYFTTVARENGTISFNIWYDMGTEYITSISYSTDNGETWITTNNTNNKSEHLVITVNVSKGDKVLWKGNATQTAVYDADYVSYFSSTCEVDIKGNIMSLLYGDNFDKQTTIIPKGCFYYLFGNFDGYTCKIVNASMLILPATTLSENCYQSMFEGCTSLINAPKLPATTLAEYCYGYMFLDCTHLTTAPKLPATILAECCYTDMFGNCINLTNAPKLPAISLAEYCYDSMFSGCTSLETAPELPATILAHSCYANMFRGCTNLITAPELSATTLANRSYSGMFRNCTNLNSITCLATDISAQDCTHYWVENVAITGTFIKHPSMNNWQTGVSSIPEGWTTTNAVSENYLTFNILSDGIINWKASNIAAETILYSINDGEWTNITSSVSGTSFNVNTGDKVRFKGNNAYYAVSSSNYTTFDGSTASFDLEGNIMSLVDEVLFDYNTVLNTNYTFIYLFKNTNIVNANNLILPAITLSKYCYYGMFIDCKSLITAPELPAITLAKECYKYMFGGCRSLTTAPELPAITLADHCYNYMFSGCISLEITPELPATILAEGCYDHMFQSCTSLTRVSELPVTTLITECYCCMFQGCTSLTTAPELPATTLASGCYKSMFIGCTSLTRTPKLPATTLADSCYYSMFQGCTSLTTAPELPATTLANNCYYSMFQSCTSLTTAPELPATTLVYSCYYHMFYGCTSLTTTPELPATILANYCYTYMFTNCTNLITASELPATILRYGCYNGMFQGCTNLTTAPELPATTLAEYCYYGMFQFCTNLTTAPELPATTLANDCYSFMFGDCTSLTTAPELHATTLRHYCYQCMFRNCTNLNSITCLATDISTTNCTDNWLYNVARIGTFIKADKMNNWTVGYSGIPTNWDIIDYYTNEYFTTVARENGTISFNIHESMGGEYITSISYSTNNGNTWNTTNNTNNKSENIVINVNVNAGDKVMWKCDAVQYAYYNNMSEDYESSFFSSTCEFDAQGNIMSLLYGDNFNNKITLEDSYTFCKLFSDYKHQKTCNIVNANNLILPATSLADGCYQYMFLDCTSLETAPELPATTLSDYCYWGMFNGCTSLETAPELPATTLTDACYCEMFYDCTSLTKSPELSAATLTRSCYHGMFNGCTSLNSIICLATDISAYNCTYHWVSDVATTGTFIKHPSISNWTIGRDGIPENWNIQNYAHKLLAIYVDDFPQGRLNETVEEVMNRELNNFDEYGNRYDYTGETIIYNENTYYLWKIPDEYVSSSNVLYLLTTTIDSDTLYSQSLEDDLTNHFTSFAGRLDEDKEEIYLGDTAIGTEYELRLVKVISTLRIWIDDFPQDDHGNLDGEPVQDVMQMSVEDPEVLGNNPYDYTGETIEYNGNTYYLWKAVDGYDADNSCSMYFATTTVDFNTLYNQSLEDDLSNHFTAAIGIFDDSKDMYWEQGINPDDGTDNHYLVKVEML